MFDGKNKILSNEENIREKNKHKRSRELKQLYKNKKNKSKERKHTKKFK